ncbi:MAG: hypothetical protein Kow0089_01500 [Desulfobulbaceae bacterium]
MHRCDLERYYDGSGTDQSEYNGNRYHAWTAGDDWVVERCADGSYHRHCVMHGTTAVEGITINTRYSDHPTGIGVGKMYLSTDRKSYRTSYTAENQKYDEIIVFIGRPIVCPATP